ncbi:MAG: S41 family peptidase [Agriterribacter sp.]
MKRTSSRFLIFTTIVVLSIFFTSAKSQQKSSVSKYKPLRENHKINAVIKGYWKSIGSGYILKATGDSVLLYSYTSHFCYKEKNDYIEELLNSQSCFVKHHDTVSIFLADYGAKTYGLQIKSDFIKIDKLPQNTLSFSEMQQLNPKKLFELFIETLKENYAFSKERNMNWDSIRNEYEKKVSDKTTKAELFQIFGQIVSLTKDHHTKIIAENGETLQYRGTPAAEIVTSVFNKQSKVKNLNEYFNLFFETNYKNISDSLLHGKGSKSANKQIEWGDLNDSIGYISIYSFTDFAPDSFSRKQQIDSINSSMQHIINAMKDKKAIIVDISFNFGGYDAAALSIAGFFADNPTLAYTSQVYNNGTFYNESDVYVQPSEKIQYTKPVYVLMSDISRSAAEGFAMLMKVLPNVKLVGTNTMGILSSMLGKSIGDFYSTSSNQRLLSPEGKYYEVSGVKPGIPITIFSKENILGGHKQAVRELMKIIERQ